VECRCDRELTLARLSRRQTEDRDPSDAGPELYEYSSQRFDSTDTWPAEQRLVVDTDSEHWQSDLEKDTRLRLLPNR
jgi:hypothetical protein